MSKRNKSKQQKSTGLDLHQFEMRPVEMSDKWCQKKMLRNGEIPPGKAPFGYIVTIPYVPSKNSYLNEVNGCIIRSKKHCGKLYLQVIPDVWRAGPYGIKSVAKQAPKSGKKRNKKKKWFRILNILNLRKHDFNEKV